MYTTRGKAYLGRVLNDLQSSQVCSSELGRCTRRAECTIPPNLLERVVERSIFLCKKLSSLTLAGNRYLEVEVVIKNVPA